jgi:hypothetical protein
MAETIAAVVYYHAKCLSCVRGWMIATAIPSHEYNTKCTCGGSLKLEKSKHQPKKV